MTESPSMDFKGVWQAYLDSIVQYKEKPGWKVLDKDGNVLNEGPGIDLTGEGNS